MTAHLLLLLSSLFCTEAHAQRRAVMENLATTGTSLFVSSTAVRVGIGTASPAYTLDVAGTSRIGSGGTPIAIISTGSYTPTASNGSNVTASSPGKAMFTRFGNIVTVVGNTDITTTAGTTITTIGLSLPVATTHATLYDLQGVLTNGNGEAYGVCLASMTVNRVLIQFKSVTATNVGYNYLYMYMVQ